MAPKATPPADDEVGTPAPADQSPSVPDLLDLLTSGATFAGTAVRSLRIELADGRVQRFELPVAGGAAGESPMAFALAQVVDEMPVGSVLSYERLAKKAGYANSGKFREVVKEYADASGRVVPHRMGWEKVK